jgi:hypothetical protein
VPSDPEFGTILQIHLSVCSTPGGLGPNGDAHRQQKQISLREMHFLLSGSDLSPIDSDQKSAIFDMLLYKLLRIDPVFPSALATSLYTIELVEPEWNTLALCYDVLQRFMRSFADFEDLNLDLVKRFMFLTQLPDQRERRAIQAVLVQFFEGHPEHRTAFLKALTSRLLLLQADVVIPLSGTVLLAVVRQILPLAAQPYHAEVNQLFMIGILPLLKSHWFSVFAAAFNTLFCEEIPKFFPAFPLAVIRSMQSNWPRTSPGKQACFAQTLTVIIAVLPEPAVSEQLPIVMGIFIKLLTGTNFLAMRAILPNLAQREWRRPLARLPAPLKRDLRDALIDLGCGHWEPNIREGARRLSELYATELTADEKRGKSILAANPAGNQRPGTDRFLEGWRTVLKGGIGTCPAVDPAAFMRKVSELVIKASEDNESGGSALFRSSRRSTCDGKVLTLRPPPS